METEQTTAPCLEIITIPVLQAMQFSYLYIIYIKSELSQ